MKAISLFCGVGGMDLGFKQAGVDIVWSNDCWADAAETYKKNIGKHIVCESIEKINFKQVPNADVVIGGFPCQGFSIANTSRNIDDERNILYRYFVKAIRSKQPKLFIAENVKGILNFEKGIIFKQILHDFIESGYRCKYVVLNAANYGVPQSRERVFILGIREDLDYAIDFPPIATHSRFPNGKVKPLITVGEVLKGLPSADEPNKLKNHIYSKYKVKFNGYISNRRIDPSKPSPTVTARGDNKGGAMIMPHPFENRRMTCRELAIIQGFPMGFEFIGAMTSIYQQIGNAVPPPLAKAVAESIVNLKRASGGSRDFISKVEKQLVFQ